jgi:metal-responsive CopG/Arc/MetJ family transcriptional regulator
MNSQIKRTTISIDESTMKMIDDYANKLKANRSRVIEMIIIEYFNKFESTQK